MSQCYTASPYLVDFEVGRSFRESQMVEQVRKNMEKANRRVYRGSQVLHFYDTRFAAEEPETKTSCK
jgi:hypothetical protein